MNKKTARLAGSVYLLVVITGIFHLIYVPSQTVVPGDEAATIGRITANESLFRLGIASGFVCYTAFLILPFILYKLLSHAGRDAATLMVALVVASVPISYIALTNNLNVVSLLRGSKSLQTIPKEQLNAEVMLSFAAYHNGILASHIFWALWLIPFGYLVLKSRSLPRFLGILLIVGSAGYLVDVFGRLLWPDYSRTAIPDVVTIPGSIGEIGICLWLLFFGVREPAGEEMERASVVPADLSSSRRG